MEYAGKTFRTAKVSVNRVTMAQRLRGATSTPTVVGVKRSKKIIAGSQTPPLPAPPTPTSKRVTIKPVQSFGKKKFK